MDERLTTPTPDPTPTPRELDSVDRKVLTLLYRGVADAYRPQRYDRDEDDE